MTDTTKIFICILYNMKENKETIDYSIFAKQLFIFILIVSCNYMKEIMSCSIQDKLNDSMMLKHILALMTMYFFVTMIHDVHANNPFYSLLIAFGLYIWFIILSRTNRNVLLYIILILFIMYILNIYTQYYKQKENNIQTIDRLYVVNKVLFIISILLTIYGFVLYLGYKKYNYGKKFNYYTFFIGSVKCKFKHLNEKLSFNHIDYIKKAFNIT